MHNKQFQPTVPLRGPAAELRRWGLNRIMSTQLIRSVVLVLVLLPISAAAAEKGWFGFGLRTEFDGSFWNPILSSASIAQVAPGSPTEKNGLAVGDVVLEIEGLAVPSATGEQLKKIKAVLDRSSVVGDKLHLQLRRTNGESYSVVLVADPRP